MCGQAVRVVERRPAWACARRAQGIALILRRSDPLETLASTFALFLVTTPTCHGPWTIRCVCISLFHLASPFNLESLNLCTPSAPSGIVVLSMLVPDLPPPRFWLARIAYPPCSLDQGHSE